MSIVKLSLITIVLMFHQNIFAGCLEPEKTIYEGKMTVESCSYRTVSDAQYDDPRLTGVKASNKAGGNPTDILGTNRKSGDPKIAKLSPEDRGVLLVGKVLGQDKPLTAFYRTKDAKYCDGLTKSNILDVSVAELCCDCMNSCIETPCALNTKNEIKKQKLIAK